MLNAGLEVQKTEAGDLDASTTDPCLELPTIFFEAPSSFLSFTSSRVALYLDLTSGCDVVERSPTFLELFALSSRRPGTAIEDIRRRICGRGSNGPAGCTACRGV